MHKKLEKTRMTCSVSLSTWDGPNQIVQCNLDLVTPLVSAKTVTKLHNVTKSNDFMQFMKNCLRKIVTKSQIVTKFNVTKSRISFEHCNSCKNNQQLPLNFERKHIFSAVTINTQCIGVVTVVVLYQISKSLETCQCNELHNFGR